MERHPLVKIRARGDAARAHLRRTRSSPVGARTCDRPPSRAPAAIKRLVVRSPLCRGRCRDCPDRRTAILIRPAVGTDGSFIDAPDLADDSPEPNYPRKTKDSPQTKAITSAMVKTRLAVASRLMEFPFGTLRMRPIHRRQKATVARRIQQVIPDPGGQPHETTAEAEDRICGQPEVLGELQ